MATLTRTLSILDADGRPFRKSVSTQAVRGSYDSAQTTTDDVRHWSQTDALSPDAANSPAVRKRLRERARYEVANNGWARSMVDTLAHEVIGTGPRVQVLSGNPEADEWIEDQFERWAAEINLARKLRTMRKAKAQDGEGIALFYNNHLLRGDVQLDLRPIETEQLATPGILLAPDQIDGIDLDENDNPVRYHVLKYHPGGEQYGASFHEEITPAPTVGEVIHVFRRDRPGQHRGIPEITPALPIFSRLRRYTLAVLQSAENVAEITLLLKTRHPEDGGAILSGTTQGEPSEYTPFDVFDIERGMISVLPADTDLFQPDPKQPSSTHTEFIKTNLAEAFACVCMPYSVGAADSSDENFASGKLTRLGFKRAVRIERDLDWNPEVRRIFAEWWREKRYAVPAGLQAGVRPFSEWVVVIFWDGTEDIDPEKAARAKAAMLETGQISYPSLFAEMGLDYENEQQAQAKALGMTVDEYRNRLADRLFPPIGQPGVNQAGANQSKANKGGKPDVDAK